MSGAASAPDDGFAIQRKCENPLGRLVPQRVLYVGSWSSTEWVSTQGQAVEKLCRPILTRCQNSDIVQMLT